MKQTLGRKTMTIVLIAKGKNIIQEILNNELK